MQAQNDRLQVKTFRASDDDVLLLKAVARSLGITSSAFIRRAIRAEAERVLQEEQPR